MHPLITAIVFEDYHILRELGFSLRHSHIFAITDGTKHIRGCQHKTTILVNIKAEELPDDIKQALENTMVTTGGKFQEIEL